MATYSTDTLNALAHDICYGEAALPGATLSGIVGDPAHAASGGYHISREDQVNPNNFSVVLWLDKQGPSNRAAAIDRSMPTSSMVIAWNRWMTVYNDPNHPARTYCRAYNGWNGVGSAERLDFAKQTRTVTDSSHTWHDHEEIYRMYVNDPMMRVVMRMTHMGYSAADIRAAIAPVPPVSPLPPEEDEDMKPLVVFTAATSSAPARWAIGTVSGGQKIWIETLDQDQGTAFAISQGVNANTLSQSSFSEARNQFDGTAAIS